MYGILHTCFSPRWMYRRINTEHGEIFHCRQPEGWNHSMLISCPGLTPIPSSFPSPSRWFTRD